MWLDLKKCTFVIFVITMFSLLAVQPAFSLESDFISTGNSTVGVPSTTSYADLLNGNIDKENNPQGLKFDNVSSNKVILHQGENNNILNSSGGFNIDFKIPKGYEFTFEIIVKSGIFSPDHFNEIEITIKDGKDKKIKIEPHDSMGHKYEYFLINDSLSDGITIRDKIPPSDGEWFINSSNDCDIHIEGKKDNSNLNLPLEFYVIFNDSTA